jgi:hypothetical protein
MNSLKVLFLLYLSLAATDVLAATLYIDPPMATLNRGDAITLSVRLDTNESEGECINAIDGVITYSENITPVDISVGESILPVWVEAPTIDKNKRQITFAGGIPNGYCGRVQGDPRLTNTVVQLVFRSPGLQIGTVTNDDSVATIGFAPESGAYLNDGFGTPAELQTLGTTLTLNKNIGGEIIDTWRLAIQDDEIPPEPFSITLEKDQFAFEKKYYISFNTSDKQTGISHYEVLEEAPAEANSFFFGAATAPWQEVRSPYVVRDQSLRSTIRVRAVDKAGNEYVATLAPQNTSSDTLWLYGVLAAAGMLTLILISIILMWRKRRRSKVVAAVISNDVTL